MDGGSIPPGSTNWTAENGLSARQVSAPVRLHDTALVPLPVAILAGRSLVVLLLALGQPDLELGPALLPVELQRHQRVAAPLHRAEEMIELPAAQQELAGARRIRIDVRRGRDQRIDMRAVEKRLAVLQVHIGLGNLRLARAHALDLPAEKGNAGLVVLLDEVIEARLAVDRDRGQFVRVFRHIDGPGWASKSTISWAAVPTIRQQEPRFAARRTQRPRHVHCRADVCPGELRAALS